MDTKELEHKVMGFMRNSEDKYAKHLITELIDALRLRDKEVEHWKGEKVVTVYKDRPESDYQEYNFGPGGA